MQDFSNNDKEKKLPERPLECSECKKKIAVRYTEMANGQTHETSMCNDCPELQKKLKRITSSSDIDKEHATTGLACGDCGTTLVAVKVGNPLGCSHCYEVFGETIIYEMYSMGKFPLHLNTENKAESLHSGRSPGEIIEVNHSLRLIALNEALKETLLKEDYEQAALLRDQINELTAQNDLPTEIKEEEKNEE